MDTQDIRRVLYINGRPQPQSVVPDVPVAPFPSRSLFVSEGGWPAEANPDVFFTTISAALVKAATMSPVATDPVLIVVAPGTFTEDLVLVSNVHIIGTGARSTRHSGNITWTPGAGVNVAYKALAEEVGISNMRLNGNTFTYTATAKTGSTAVFDARNCSLPHTINFTARSGTIDYLQLTNCIGASTTITWANGVAVVNATEIDGSVALSGTALFFFEGCQIIGAFTTTNSAQGELVACLVYGNVTASNTSAIYTAGCIFAGNLVCNVGAGMDLRTSTYESNQISGAGIIDRRHHRITTGTTAAGANAITITPPLSTTRYSVAVTQLTGVATIARILSKTTTGFSLNDSAGGNTFELTVLFD